ncbi:MAG: TerC/Alx family metal homeostasis membrane protein [Prevotellaceae bacterium]|jgi:tellurite resistance protein TerC|nr:TerC/Alx family metal homeostasis membrane protein [Prevotellaceae bacterium]
MNEIFFLGGFLLLIAGILTLDLGVFNRHTHEVKLKEALGFTVLWVSLALLFFVFLRFFGHLIHDIQTQEQLDAINLNHRHGLKFLAESDFVQNLQLYRKQLSMEFITGYLIEYALSIDNIFVILMLFMSFKVDRQYHHRVLFWGIIGAVIMRFIFIFTLSALVHKFEWVLMMFGVILIYSAIKMFLNRNTEENVEEEEHRIVKTVSKYFRVTKNFIGEKFFAKIDGKRYITPLFLVLIIIEVSDVIFAVDSVPAIFSITKDSYIVFFSNIFAIIGLRSLFFLLSSIMKMFRFLKTGLSVLLAFVGVKMLLEFIIRIHISIQFSLIFILSILVLCILFSILIPEKTKQEEINNEKETDCEEPVINNNDMEKIY